VLFLLNERALLRRGRTRLWRCCCFYGGRKFLVRLDQQLRHSALASSAGARAPAVPAIVKGRPTPTDGGLDAAAGLVARASCPARSSPARAIRARTGPVPHLFPDRRLRLMLSSLLLLFSSRARTNPCGRIRVVMVGALGRSGSAANIAAGGHRRPERGEPPGESAFLRGHLGRPFSDRWGRYSLGLARVPVESCFSTLPTRSGARSWTAAGTGRQFQARPPPAHPDSGPGAASRCQQRQPAPRDDTLFHQPAGAGARRKPVKVVAFSDSRHGVPGPPPASWWSGWSHLFLPELGDVAACPRS